MPDVGPEKHPSECRPSVASDAIAWEPRGVVVRSIRKSPSTPAEALIVPILRYRDPLAAVEWLGHAFGLNCHVDADQGRTIAHAQFRLGRALVFLGPECVGAGSGAGSAMQLDGLGQPHAHCDERERRCSLRASASVRRRNPTATARHTLWKSRICVPRSRGVRLERR